jgi:folate-binding protein YgfZ
MTDTVRHADLPSRAVIALEGPDWRSFVQGLITQDVETLAPGEIRFAALLTPQGRVLFDLFIVGAMDGCLIDCAADQRDALIQKLTMYRLRAKVAIAPSDLTVQAAWTDDLSAGPPASSRPLSAAWLEDPRLPALGSRGYGAEAPPGCEAANEAAYLSHCLRLGVPVSADWGSDTTYPIEANFDLLNGIDFRKGCFVGQETTSRMKRRGTIKNRMAPITFDGPPPEPGTEVLAGDLRAGAALSGEAGVAMALLRIDRVEAGNLAIADGRLCRVEWPDWLETPIGAQPPRQGSTDSAAQPLPS